MNFIQPKTYRLFSVVLLIAGLLSCSRGVIDPDVQEDNIPMKFNASVGWGVKSRSLINDAEDLQSHKISVLAKAEVGENVYSAFQNDELYYENGDWTYGAAKYWIYGAKYSFAAFAPFASDDAVTNTLSNGTVSFSDNELTITGYNTVLDQARTEDLLVAHYVRDNSDAKDYSAVPLSFGHLLSCVSFNIRNTTNDNIIKVTSIQLDGLQYECNITLNTSSVTVANSAVTSQISSADRIGTEGNPFLPKGMSENDYKQLFDCEYLTLLPQTLYQKDIKLTFKVHEVDNINGTEYSFSLGDVETVRRWEAGKKYDYSISITSTNILFQVVEVPWIEHDVEL